jgi:hypothetical protein
VSQAEKQFQDNDKDTLEALNKLREMQMDWLMQVNLVVT